MEKHQELKAFGLISVLLMQTLWSAIPAYSESNVAPITESIFKAESPIADSPTDKKLTVEDIAVEGNRLVPTEDILSVVKTKRGDPFDRQQVLEDLKAVNSMGYFDDRNLQVVPQISSSGGVLLKIRVQENAPVTQFAFQGNQVVSTEEISKVFADQLGKPQNLNQLSAAIDKVEQAYHQKGYVLARITDVKDDPDGSISLSINEGSIADVKIVGNRKTKDFIIRNAIKIKPGAVYNERQLTTDLRKLYANGYFQDIRRSLAPSATDPDKYTLKVEVEEKRTGSVGLGGGVDTSAGPFGSLSFSDANFRGRGQVLSFNSQVGTGQLGNITNTLSNNGQSLSPNRTYQIEGTWIDPSIRGSDVSMAVSGYGRDLNSMVVDYAEQRTIGTSVTFTKPLGHHFAANLSFIGDNTSLSNTGTFDQQQNIDNQLMSRAIQLGDVSNINDAQTLATQVRNNQLKGGTFFTVNPSITYDTRDNRLDPQSGAFAKITGSPSVGITGTTFAKLGASVSKYIPVTHNTTLAFNLQGGTSFGSLPQFAQYRLGGLSGLPGYRAFTDLGTGSSMLMASAEYRFPLPFLPKDGKAGKIAKHFKGVVFFDAGEVGGNTLTNSLFSRSTLGASTGLGLRISVPMIGVVRINYGLPLISTILGKMTPRFSVGFGNQF